MGGGGLDLFLWAQILIIDLQYLCFAAALVLADSGNAIVEPFFYLNGSQWKWEDLKWEDLELVFKRDNNSNKVSILARDDFMVRIQI